MKIIAQIPQIAQSKVFRFILAQKKFKVEDSIIIFSEPRGGSTWLMEILNQIPLTCINWEPLAKKGIIIPKSFKLGWRPFIPENSQDQDYIRFFQSILEFSIHNNSAFKFLNSYNLIKSKFVITKFIRANLLVPFILSNFNFKNKPILLLRHPIDVSLSQIKKFKQTENRIAKVKQQNLINYKKIYGKIDFINQLNSPLEIKITQWCLNNVYTINRVNEIENLNVIYYSDLLINPISTIQAIIDEFTIDIPNYFIDSIDFSKPSSTTIIGELKTSSDKQLYKNFKILDNYTKNKVQAIFDHFNFKLYNAFSPLPQKNNI